MRRRRRAPAGRRPPEDHWAPAGGMLAVLPVTVVIRGVVSVTVHFAPMWLLIPFVLAVPGGVGRGSR